ncbi:hypothetical protein HHJ78_04425 [Mobiluncus mulieris]|uniref:Uncharacterized protein n=1 Tax=Mobiluncus mulieris TaxID=2052 RepID=A0A7Y0U0Z1_9ACTO|nr:hypothetical protein [Mobiluncus mulieris]NMW64792.1 hypothetical protein [Mobiluncus mulieris]
MSNYLPGFEPIPPGKGYVEQELEKTLGKLRDSKQIGDESAGMAALAIMAARSLDQMGAKGAPSGRAMLLNAAREIFASLQPEKTTTETETVLPDILKAIKDPTDESVVEFTSHVA